MKKMHIKFSAALIALIAALITGTAHAAPFTPGNLAILRFGDGTSALSGAGTPVFIDEYTTGGVFVQTIPIPTAPPNALVVAGNATAEGAMMRAPNGKFLCFGGYNAAVGVAAIAGTTGTVAPREVATVDANGLFAIAASSTTQFSTQNIRNGVTDGINNFWASGSGAPGGTYYYGFNAPAVTVQGTLTSTRVQTIQNGNLYMSTATTGSSGPGIYGFPGTPTVATPITSYLSTGTGSSPYGFAINASGTVAYIADDRTIATGGGIQRWVNSGGPWTLAYTLNTGAGSTVGARGIVVDWSGANPVIYATTSEGVTTPNRLVKVTDTGAGSAVTSIATVGQNRAFRGVAFSPASQPQPPVQVYGTPVLPPTNGVYISPQQWHALYANGIVISNVSHRRFTGGQPPPPPGGVQVHTFDSLVEMDVSQGNGQPLVPASAPAHVSVQVTGRPDGITFDTEMLALDIAGGTLPPGVMIRESPTKQSLGQTTVRPVTGGYMIDSFFDIFTEISLDGGANWSPAQQAGHVELRIDPTTIPPIQAPTPLLPPPNDKYVSPRDFHLALASGILISNISHRFFTQSQPPPPPNGPIQTHQFDSQVDMALSTDGGVTFRSVRAPAAVAISVRHRMSAADGTQIYDTEMLALNLQGGDLPPGMMLRESPTRRSEGGTAILPNSDGTQRIGSFFDVFLELSADAGATWQPAPRPAHVELQCTAPEVPKPSPNLPPPDGQYVSPEQYHAAFANGIIIKNVSHDRFTQSTPPPPPGGTQVHQFGSQVSFLVSLDGGQTFSPASAPAQVAVRVDSRIDSGPTRFFDTEMLQLSISGGSLPAGVMVRESPSKQSLGRTSIRMVNDPATGIWDYISSFFDIFTEVSLDGGQNWSPAANGPAEMDLRRPLVPITIACPADITVAPAAANGTVVQFSPTASGGCDAAPSLACNPPSGSTFPVGITTVTCIASDSCGQSASCTFNITVRNPQPWWFPNPNLPPLQGEYVSPQRWHQLYANGIIISNVSHRRFLQSFPPPASGTTETHSFGSDVAGEVSLDGGHTFMPFVVMGTADVTVRITHAGTVGTTQTYDTEMLSMVLMTTNGLKLRESPSKASLGRTTVTPNPGGGFVIQSFFDVFTELSLDGGQTWSPAQSPAHVELRDDPRVTTPIVAPTPLLPPPVDLYVSPQQYHILLSQGIVVRNVRHKLFTQSLPPPVPGVKVTHDFGSQVDLEMSMDNGATFRPMRAPAQVSVSLQHRSNSTDGTQVYDTEMLQLDIRGGDLPAGVMLRESPTRASMGGTAVTPTPDGQFRIGSFFDIFTEVSLDGGQNWTAAQGVVNVQLICETPPIPLTNPNLPPLDGQYISPQQWHALYAQGIIISNVSHKRFTQTFPPPPPGALDSHSFGSVVECDLSLNNGQTWQHGSLPAQVTVSLREQTSSGDTRFFETEMLALNIQGGALPAGAMIRESPSKQSLGRTSIRMVNDPATGIWDYISSFFDVFTELSMDGGQTWSPSVTGPGTVHVVPAIPINCAIITCSSNILAWTCSGNGAVVNYTVGASNICGGTISVSCAPASGSTFPIGVTTVACTATSFNSSGVVNGTTNCTFTVTVIRDTKPPTLACPNSITTRSCADREIVFYTTPSATDDCDPAPVVSCLPPSGSVFPAGTTTVNCTARDACSNKTNCTFAVTVVAEPLPKMTVRILLANGQAQLQMCWSTPCLGYHLQCIRGFEPPLLWENVTNAVQVSNGTNYCVTVPLQPNRRFYRLVRNTAKEVFSSTDTLPPVGSYTSPANEVVVFGNGIITRWFVHRIPPLLCPPNCAIPPCATCPDPIILSFSTTLEAQYSVDGGQTFQNASISNVPTRVAVHGGVNGQNGPVRYLDTEMISMAASGGSLPAGVMLRESPTLSSLGKHVIRTIDGGFRIGSFFDVFLELSVDGGQTWSPALTPVRVDYDSPVTDNAYSTDTFPPVGTYVNPATVPSTYANGIIARGFRHVIPPQSCPPNCPKPPPCLACGPEFYDIPTQLSFEVSSNGGQTFTSASMSMQTRLTARHSEDTADTRFFDVEVLSMNSPTVPPGNGVMLRESPTIRSTGKTTVQKPVGGGYRIGSFFDVFTEISLDGGQTWSPVVNPTHLELQTNVGSP
ncbi:MAG: hypothetical protein QOF48_1784 [Verrucomicrobiota bacterium]|jgi:hypothetical protein